MSDYSAGLRHGYEDAYEAIRKILAEDISDAEKLAKLEDWCEPRTSSGSRQAA